MISAEILCRYAENYATIEKIIKINGMYRTGIEMEKQRLDKIIASMGTYSRREVKLLVRQGKILVNQQLIKSSEEKFDPDHDVILINDEPLNYRKNTYVMLNKPKGVISATQDPRERTVLSLLPAELMKPELFPVGRLDKDTTGLLLMTDDGELAHQLLAPGRHVEKVYLVRVNGILTEQDAGKFAEGITLADGYTTLPAGLDILSDSECYVTIHEGKYHQIKRMMAALGKPVEELKRIAMGPLKLDDSLAEGEWRFLTDEEIMSLKKTKEK